MRGYLTVTLLLVVVGDRDPAPLRSVLDDPVTVTVPDRPERAELNAALDRRGERRLVVAADDAGLGAVLRRLLRRDELASTPVALLAAADSVVRARLGLPVELAAAASVAVTGRPTRQGLVRDDHGGLTLGSARLLPWAGTSLGMRAYVDEHELVSGSAPELTVTYGASQLTAAVEPPRRLRRRRALSGRAATVSCDEARLVVDGVAHERPQTRCSWWFEPDCWQVVLPG